MKALVTGGAGFIGSHLCRHLQESGWDVVALDNLSGGFRSNLPSGIPLDETDLTDPAATLRAVSRIQADVVFHCAAYAPEGLSPWIRRYIYQQNLMASANLLNAVLTVGVDRLLFTSSMSVYGVGSPPYKESQQLAPTTPYGIAKYAVEQDIASASRLFGLNYTIIRPHNVYGPHQNLSDPYRNVIGIFMRHARNGQPLPVFNDGSQVRAFSYIDDIIPPIILAATNPDANRETFNIGGDTPHTIMNIVDAMRVEFGGNLAVNMVGHRPEVHTAWCDHTKAKTVLGFNPQTSLTEGISRMAAWARTADIQPTEHPHPELTRNLPKHWMT